LLTASCFKNLLISKNTSLVILFIFLGFFGKGVGSLFPFPEAVQDNVKYFVDFSLDRIIKKANLLYLGIFKILMALSKERRLAYGYCQRNNF